MSDSLITFIPQNPDYVPSAQAQQLGANLVKSLSSKAERVHVECSAKLRFIDCGENFERIGCPLCAKDIDLDWWHEQTDQVFSSGVLMPVSLRCCGATKTLNELAYEWPQGFCRFSLEVMNPPDPSFAEEHIEKLEELLGCDLRIIYTHI
ncbi:MAG: hypothetical protein Q8N18_19000 [Opitutaceae bacterium]|nr:hypothetical protein [Opitutaceae bacterium]